MQEIATYYVTLKPTREGGVSPVGLNNIAYVSDPAVDEVGIYLNAHDARIVADENIQKSILDYLKSCGQVKPTNWTEVSEEDYLANRELNMAVTDQESYNDVSKKDGSGQWLVRYEYDGPSDEKTRSFCSDILSLGRLYTEEEIKNGLSNPEFGNYSIWDYKGSYGCRHVWKRRIYFEDYEDGDVRRVGFVPQVVAMLDDFEATTLNAYLSKDEKMQVVAPLLIPDKDIFRNDEIGRYNMRFSTDTIVELRNVAMSREVFQKSDLFKDTHEGQAAPSYVIEQWITESPEDKAYTEYGFNLSKCPIGTWFVLSQVTDKGYWEKEIKGNKKYTYSIEALINLSIIKLSVQQYGDVVVYNDKGEFLLLQRHTEDDYEPNKLCFAGGKIEDGEDIKQGALRELFEETGIKSDDATFIDSIKNSDGTISNYFQVTTNQEFKPSHEHKGYSWVKSLDNFSDDMFIEGDKQRLVQIINKSKMTEGQIVIKDGDYLIDGKMYTFKGGIPVAEVEVAPEQEDVIKDIATEGLSETLVVEEEVKVEEVLEDAPVVTEEAPTTTTEEPDRLAKLEADQEALMGEIAKLKADLVAPKTEDVAVAMSDKRPLWKRISDGLNAHKQINN